MMSVGGNFSLALPITLRTEILTRSDSLSLKHSFADEVEGFANYLSYMKISNLEDFKLLRRRTDAES